MRGARAWLAGVVTLVGCVAFAPIASGAAEEAPETQLFASATESLRDGRPGDAITQLESLADRGVVDAAASFDRGVAYANRIRVGGEQPGDLGRAAHGFEEARELTRDPSLARDATSALALVRAEVAHRRARAGDPVELDQGASLGRTVVHLVSEGAWAAAAMALSFALGLALFVRSFATTGRRRVGATVACAIVGPLFVLFAVFALTAREDRLHLREGVIVSASARPANERGLVTPGASPVPEAARVQVVDTKPGWARVRWGSLDAWIPSQAVRAIARAE